MATDVATLPVKFHISLNVSDLDRAVAFYRVLFGKEAVKHRPDYAKFESDDPQLVLSLEPNALPAGGSLNHLGFRLGDSTALVDLQRRFETAGIRTTREEGVECCYALQTKFWVTDPDRNLWELYVLHEDLEHRGMGQTLEQMAPGTLEQQSPKAPAAAPQIWHHVLGMDLPPRLPQADDSLDEVHLQGTFNVPLADEARDRLLAEVLRVLRPGGKLMIHNLVGNKPLADKPNLPGPAALVEAVPVDSQLFQAVERAGFEAIELEKFGASPCFTLAGVEMRELKLHAQKGAGACCGQDWLAVYKGPLRQVTDDAGHVFPRGERVRICEATKTQLAGGAVAEQFVFLPAESLVTIGGCRR